VNWKTSEEISIFKKIFYNFFKVILLPSVEQPVRPASSAQVQIPVFGLKTKPCGHVYIFAFPSTQ
jgi:hypothetical protein